jgi:hypothetical protein
MRNAFKILDGNLERKTPRGKLRRRWKDKIKKNVEGKFFVKCGLGSSGSG